MHIAFLAVTSLDPYQDVTEWKPLGAPATVRIACGALFAMGLILLAQIVVALYEVFAINSIVARLAPGAGASASEIAHFKSDERSYALFFSGLIFLFMAFLWLAAVNSRLGKRSGQALAIVNSIPLLLCFAVPFLPGDETKLEIAFANAEPAWAVVIDYITYAVSPLALLVIVLMLTRSARQHFSWLPPAPSGYMWAPAQLPWPYQAPSARGEAEHDQPR